MLSPHYSLASDAVLVLGVWRGGFTYRRNACIRIYQNVKKLRVSRYLCIQRPCTLLKCPCFIVGMVAMPLSTYYGVWKSLHAQLGIAMQSSGCCASPGRCRAGGETYGANVHMHHSMFLIREFLRYDARPCYVETPKAPSSPRLTSLMNCESLCNSHLFMNLFSLICKSIHWLVTEKQGLLRSNLDPEYIQNTHPRRPAPLNSSS